MSKQFWVKKDFGQNKLGPTNVECTKFLVQKALNPNNSEPKLIYEP